jgi:predicted nucleotidyltransferase
LTTPAFDQLLRRLSEAGVEFILIGGLAVNAWGVVRGTKDIDIVIAPDAENLNRVAKVAVEAHGHVETGESFLSTSFSIAAQLATGDRVAIETEMGLLDVVQGLDGVPPYEELRTSAIETEILGVKVSVCSIDALRQMKRSAGRPRDHVDLEDLAATGQ